MNRWRGSWPTPTSDPTGSTTTLPCSPSRDRSPSPSKLVPAPGHLVTPGPHVTPGPLVTPVPRYIQPLCLPTGRYSQETFTHTLPMALGWGTTYYDGHEVIASQTIRRGKIFHLMRKYFRLTSCAACPSWCGPTRTATRPTSSPSPRSSSARATLTAAATRARATAAAPSCCTIRYGCE